jgi:hypothetical protein
LTVTNLALAKALFATSETGSVDSVSTNVPGGGSGDLSPHRHVAGDHHHEPAAGRRSAPGLAYVNGSARTDLSGFNGTLGTLNVLGPTGAPGTLAPNSSNLVVQFGGETG